MKTLIVALTLFQTAVATAQETSFCANPAQFAAATFIQLRAIGYDMDKIPAPRMIDPLFVGTVESDPQKNLPGAPAGATRMLYDFSFFDVSKNLNDRIHVVVDMYQKDARELCDIKSIASVR